MRPAGTVYHRRDARATRGAQPAGPKAMGLFGRLLCGLLFAPLATAQYSYDPSAADELSKPGHIYFGASRDETGRYVPSVTIVLESELTNFVLITDAQGRFRARLPPDTLPANVRVTCSKPGYLVLRVTRRLPPRAARSPVQVDCVLRRQSAPQGAVAP